MGYPITDLINEKEEINPIVKDSLTRTEIKSILKESIDFTFLKNSSEDSLKKLLDIAIEDEFKHICTYSGLVEKAKKYLDERFNDIVICSVAGFPYNSNGEKICESGDEHQKRTLKEAELALNTGAKEIDIFWDITNFKFGVYGYVGKKIKDVINLVKKRGIDNILKVIVETCQLNETEIKDACWVISESGADFIKSSTGFDKYGARIRDIELMSKKIKNLERKIAIKASGGINNLEEAINFLKIPYVERLGMGSAAPKIIKEVDNYLL